MATDILTQKWHSPNAERTFGSKQSLVFTRGEVVDIQFGPLTATPRSISGATIYLYVAINANAPSSLSKLCTISGSTITASLTAANTLSLPQGTWWYVLFDDTNDEVISQGKITLNENPNESPQDAPPLADRAANTVLAGPTSGADAPPTWRALVAADIPSLSATYQPLDATLTALAGLTIAANSLTIGTGADAFSQTSFAANTFPARASTGNLVAKTITDAALSVLDDTTTAAMLVTLGAMPLAGGTFTGGIAAAGWSIDANGTATFGDTFLNTINVNDLFLVSALGLVTGAKFNGLTITTTTGTLTLANGSTLATSGANSITLTSTGATNVTLPTTGTLLSKSGAFVDNAILLSDGTAGAVKASGLTYLSAVSSGTLVGPAENWSITGLGAASLSSVNGNTISIGTGTLNLQTFTLTVAVTGTALVKSGSYVDNSLLRADGTAGAVQGSGITIDDSNNVSGVNSLSAEGLSVNTGINATSWSIESDGDAFFKDVTIDGNLTVSGDTFTANTASYTVEDPLIALGSGNAGDAVDEGWYASYTASGVKYRGIFWDASASVFRAFTGLEEAPTTTVNIAGTGYTVATIVANLTGNVSGSSGSCTGNAATATALQNARTFQTNLASTSTASFDGTANVTPGVTGTLPAGNGGTGITSGTSGGVLYFSGTTTIASSAALAANALVIGGGAGVAPSTTTTGTGVLTALGVNVGTDGAFITRGGNAGTPSAIVLTNATGTAASLTAGVASTVAITSGLGGDTTCWLLFSTGQNGNLSPATSTATYNDTTRTTTFSALASTGGSGLNVIATDSSQLNITPSSDVGKFWFVCKHNTLIEWLFLTTGDAPQAGNVVCSQFKVSGQTTGTVAGITNSITGSTVDIHQFQVNGSVKAAITKEGILQDAGMLRTSANVDNATTTLATATGLSIALPASKTYSFHAELYTTSQVDQGVKAAVVHSSVTALIYEVETLSGATIVDQTRGTASGTTGGATAVTAAKVRITGTITTNTAQTFAIQFAQNANVDTDVTTVLRGSWLRIWDSP